MVGYPPQTTGYLTPEELATLPEIEVNRLLKERTKTWVLSHPREVAYLSVMKLAYMWGIYPFWWSMYSFWSALFKTLTGNCAILLLLIASAGSLVRFRHHLRELSIFWTLPIFVTFVALVSLGNWRYRMPGDLGLIALAAALLAHPMTPKGEEIPPRSSGGQR